MPLSRSGSRYTQHQQKCRDGGQNAVFVMQTLADGDLMCQNSSHEYSIDPQKCDQSVILDQDIDEALQFGLRGLVDPVLTKSTPRDGDNCCKSINGAEIIRKLVVRVGCGGRDELFCAPPIRGVRALVAAGAHLQN